MFIINKGNIYLIGEACLIPVVSDMLGCFASEADRNLCLSYIYYMYTMRGSGAMNPYRKMPGKERHESIVQALCLKDEKKKKKLSSLIEKKEVIDFIAEYKKTQYNEYDFLIEEIEQQIQIWTESRKQTKDAKEALDITALIRVYQSDIEQYRNKSKAANEDVQQTQVFSLFLFEIPEDLKPEHYKIASL